MIAVILAAVFAATPPALDPIALGMLKTRARVSRSDALVVIHAGQTRVDETFGKPRRRIESMSVTKSFVSLAVGFLLAQGKLTSLEQKASEFIPEWRADARKEITLRHLLSHTSGLRAAQVDLKQDAWRAAKATTLEKPPGTKFVYDNNATNALAGIVGVVAGKPIDQYLGERLFAPLGITDFKWERDAAGNPYGMAGLQLYPRDLAKVGELLVNGGTWNGARLVDPKWIAQSMQTPSQQLNPECALLWWRMKREGAFEAAGIFGQYLYVDPANALVVVRMRHVEPPYREDPAEGSGDFDDFEERVYALVKRRS